MDPYLSIIVPVYNVEAYIHKCIDSILAQTFVDFELILVDDGSLDNCPHICDEYKKKDNRIKVIHKSNGGLVSARKEGLKIATGKYIGYVDSDDWIEKDMYAQLCEIAHTYSVDIVICDMISSFRDKEIKNKQMFNPGLYDKNAMKTMVYPYMLFSGSFYKFGIFPSVCNKIFNKSLLEKNQNNVNETITVGEDAACTYSCMLDANSIYILENKYLYHYRLNEFSMTKKYDDKYLDRILTLYQQFKYINNEKATFDLSLQLYYYLTYLIIGALNKKYNTNNKKSNSEKIKFIEKILLNKDINDALKNISLKKIPLKSKVYIWLLRRKQIKTLHLLLLLARNTRRVRHIGK